MAQRGVELREPEIISVAMSPTVQVFPFAENSSLQPGTSHVTIRGVDYMLYQTDGTAKERVAVAFISKDDQFIAVLATPSVRFSYDV